MRSLSFSVCASTSRVFVDEQPSVMYFRWKLISMALVKQTNYYEENLPQVLSKVWTTWPVCEPPSGTAGWPSRWVARNKRTSPEPSQCKGRFAQNRPVIEPARWPGREREDLSPLRGAGQKLPGFWPAPRSQAAGQKLSTVIICRLTRPVE